MPHLLENNVSVNTIKSIFEEIISGIPQVSIEGPILFNIFFSDFFQFILVASAHNFADDNTLLSFAKTVENLISSYSRIRNSNSNKLV